MHKKPHKEEKKNTHTYKSFYTPHRKGVFWGYENLCNQERKEKLVLIQMLSAFLVFIESA